MKGLKIVGSVDGPGEDAKIGRNKAQKSQKENGTSGDKEDSGRKMWDRNIATFKIVCRPRC